MLSVYVHGVQGDLDERTVFKGKISKVGIKAAKDGLVGNNDDVLFLAFEFEHDGLYALDEVEVGFSARVAVGELVSRSGSVFFGVLLGNLLVGEAIKVTGVDLVQKLEADLAARDVLGRLDGATHG